MKITDEIYGYIWNGVFVNNSNMFFFGEPLNILFDPGLKNYMDVRFEEMRKDGINPDNISHIVNTHCHPDHFEGAELFRDKKIPIAMHEDEISFYNEYGPKFYDMFGMKFQGFTFDTSLKEGIWQVGDTELEIYHTPGHSPGSICIYWKDKKALVCGDLVFDQSVGRVDFPGGDGKKLVESIKKISQLDIEYLLPGHMGIVTGADTIKRNFQLIEQYVFSMIQ